MAEYDEWTKAIITYFLSGLPRGSTVYLNIDEASIFDIGKRFKLDLTFGVNYLDDFINSVRDKCVKYDEINIESLLESKKITSIPFLACMVLAANRMFAEENEEKSVLETNYFIRLREVLKLKKSGSGRPNGLLPIGIEEKFWGQWNKWLLKKGWNISAEQSTNPSRKFINYPISQTLVREADKRRLEKIFMEEGKKGRIKKNWDSERVISFLRKNISQITSQHLKDLIMDLSPSRYEAITDSIFEVYLSIDWENKGLESLSVNRLNTYRNLIAGLYRVEEPLFGSVDYHLYPKQPKRWGDGKLKIYDESNNPEVLRQERPGWNYPLWAVNPSGGKAYKVEGDDDINELILPEKGFWALVKDPEDNSSGVYASWHNPVLGENFILLCKEEYKNQIELLGQEKLIEWDLCDEIKIDDQNWLEYKECSIISASWSGIIPQKEDLFEYLKPSIKASISFIGGLRVPSHGGWIEGFSPEIKITTFCNIVNLIVSNESEIINQRNLIQGQQNTNLNSLLKSGAYLIEIFNGKELLARKQMLILSWDELEKKPPLNQLFLTIGDYKLQGPIVFQ